jgi:hydantoinase/carbamoylase family amidase
MWAGKAPVAVVSAISGRQQYRVELDGVPNHAGTTPMSMRSDALTAAARVILELETMAQELSAHTVATVGKIECFPNAINVIPGVVRFTVDVRSPSADDLFEADRRLDLMIRESSATDASLTKTEEQPVVELNHALVDRLAKIAGPNVPITISGALHDAAILALYLPTAMLFVASRDGISHNPAEFSRIEDITSAAILLEKLVSDSTPLDFF